MSRDVLAHLHESTLDGVVHRNAQTLPEGTALVDATQSLTWAQLEARVDSLAGALRERGLQPGGDLLAFPRRTVELPVLFLATARAGGIFVPLDSKGVDRIDPELAASAQLIWGAPGFEEAATRAAREGDPGRVLDSSLEDLLSHPGIGSPSRDPGAVCYLNCTSGSTGRSKGAPTTHAQVQWNTRATLETFPFTSEDRFCCLFAPFAHPHEHFARPFALGATAVMIDSLRPRSVLRGLVEHGVTWLFAIPSAYELLLAHLDGEKHNSNLRIAECGGAVVTPDLVHRAEKALGCDFLPIWGCTESTGVVLHVPPWEADRPLECLGKPVAHYTAEVVDPDPVSGVGELRIQGPAVVGGYRNRAGETAERFVDGWYHTGDLVQQEADGSFRFMGRMEEMIKVGGVKVYLLEIERCVAEFPGVDQVVVVPASDRVHGETPRAVVVREAGSRLNRQDVLALCRERLPAPMVPRQVEFWDELPRTAAGKVDKRAVSERITHPVALAVNSMVIAERKLDEVFRIASDLEKNQRFSVVVDLRSRRDPETDPDGVWSLAHYNSDFDLLDPASVERAVSLSREHNVPVGAASAYIGACHPQDLGVGFDVIDGAYSLAEAAPDRTLVLRVLGGDLMARARRMTGRWQDIRVQLRNESLKTLLAWEAHTRERAATTGARVLLGMEIHHGQYLGDLHDIHHLCRGFRDIGWEYAGFIEDPANRFVATEGDRLGAMDFARMVGAWGGRILSYHLKDVRYVSGSSPFEPEPLQPVGERTFVWGTHKYEWMDLGAGEVDLEGALMAAQTLSSPPHASCMVSTEFVAASKDEEEARSLVDSYARLVRDGRPFLPEGSKTE